MDSFNVNHHGIVGFDCFRRLMFGINCPQWSSFYFTSSHTGIIVGTCKEIINNVFEFLVELFVLWYPELKIVALENLLMPLASSSA